MHLTFHLAFYSNFEIAKRNEINIADSAWLNQAMHRLQAQFPDLSVQFIMDNRSEVYHTLIQLL